MYSPRISRDMITVKMGAELFTVSANETATFFRLTRPKTTVANLEKSQSIVSVHQPMCSYSPDCDKSARAAGHTDASLP